MALSKTRQKAHKAFRDLREAVDRRVGQGDAKEYDVEGKKYKRIETAGGAVICLTDATLTVSAEFEKPDGTDEITYVIFPKDIEDMSQADVTTDWVSAGKAGSSTPPLARYPQIARELLELV